MKIIFFLCKFVIRNLSCADVFYFLTFFMVDNEKVFCYIFFHLQLKFITAFEGKRLFSPETLMSFLEEFQTSNLPPLPSFSSISLSFFHKFRIFRVQLCICVFQLGINKRLCVFLFFSSADLDSLPIILQKKYALLRDLDKSLHGNFNFIIFV